MNPTTDLHLHSYYSDGSDSPQRIVERAAAMGYKTVALTDHDGVSGIKEFVRAGEKYGVKTVAGIEFSAYYSMPNPFDPASSPRRYYLHILGYGIDPSDKRLRKALEKIMAQRSERNEKMRQWFAKQGIPMTPEELSSHSPSGYIGKTSFARLLVDRGLYANIEEAVTDRRYLANPEFRAIRREKIEAAEAIRLIKGAGGLAFAAHPFQITYDAYRMDSAATFKARREMLISALAAEGLDGLECFYSAHTPAQTAEALDLANYLHLLVSRGSDDHGEGMRPVKKMSVFASEPDPSLLAWTEKL